MKKFFIIVKKLQMEIDKFANNLSSNRNKVKQDKYFPIVIVVPLAFLGMWGNFVVGSALGIALTFLLFPASLVWFLPRSDSSKTNIVVDIIKMFTLYMFGMFAWIGILFSLFTIFFK